MDKLHFTYPFINWWTFKLFLLLAIVSDAAVKHSYIRLCVDTFLILRHMPRNEIAGSYGNSMFNFLRICQAVFQSVCTVTFPPAMYEG